MGCAAKSARKRLAAGEPNKGWISYGHQTRGIAAVRQGTSRVFYGDGPDRPAQRAARAGAHGVRARHVRAWHTHPLGQTLIVISGAGLVQREGQPVQEIRPGDVVWFEPGERHWHGASP